MPEPQSPPTHVDASSDTAADRSGPDAMMRQAAAMAVQDAVAHMRNTQMVAGAAIGMAQEMLLRNENPAFARQTIEAAEAAIVTARDNFEKVSRLSRTLLTGVAEENRGQDRLSP